MLRGVSPIERAKQSIGRTLAAGQLASSLFANGAVPGAVITSPLKLTNEQAGDIQKRYDASHKGALQAFKTVVLGADAKVNQISLTPEQVQMIDVMKFGVIDVARWYRVPPHLLGDVERSTSWGTGIAEQNSMFVIHTLTPWIVRIERALQQLVSDTFPGLDVYAKIEVKGLMRGNPIDEASYLEKKLQAQAATPNDWRRLDDENPLPDGDKVLKSVQWQPDNPAPAPAAPADVGTVDEPAL
jgi:HK97 family phage portal protein